MDFIWKCVKETCAWIIALSVAMAVVFGSFHLYEKHYVTQQVEEVEPIKLQVTGPSALSM